ERAGERSGGDKDLRGGRLVAQIPRGLVDAAGERIVILFGMPHDILSTGFEQQPAQLFPRRTRVVCRRVRSGDGIGKRGEFGGHRRLIVLKYGRVKRGNLRRRDRATLEYMGRRSALLAATGVIATVGGLCAYQKEFREYPAMEYNNFPLPEDYQEPAD